MQCTSNVVVFDLDETLGYYTEFGIFWDALNSYIKNETDKKNVMPQIDQNLFNKSLDLFPEFNRPKILNILNFLKEKKKVKNCDKLMIYTNNQGPYEWVQQIKKYFETKLDFPLFDQIINAFKVRGKRVELGRTSHMKTHKDLLTCTKLSEDTEFCFIDDKIHPGMSSHKVYYINILPYTHDLSFDEMIERFQKSGIINTNTNINMKQYLLNFMKKFNYNFKEKTKEEINLDKILSKKIMHHLNLFFEKNVENKKPKMNKTQRQILKPKNKTLKNKNYKL